MFYSFFYYEGTMLEMQEYIYESEQIPHVESEQIQYKECGQMQALTEGWRKHKKVTSVYFGDTNVN